METVRFIAYAIVAVAPFLVDRLVASIKAQFHKLAYKGPGDNPKTVVVVGGSFAGAQFVRRLTQLLPTGWQVVLVERNSHFNFSFNFPRFSVVSGYERQAFIPYHLLVENAPEGIVKVVRGEVKGIKPAAPAAGQASRGEVALSDGGSLPYDLLVIATGSASPPPSKLVHAADRDAACEELRTLQTRIRQAKTVAVVGGGAVGIELATDIKTFDGKVDGDSKTVLPADKEVTLVHSRQQLLPRFGKRIHDHTIKILEKIDVKVVLGERPEIVLDDDDVVGGPGKLRFKDRQESYDCVVVCTGLKYNNSLVRALNPDAVAPSGEIRVNKQLQVTDSAGTPLPNIFSIGDVAATGGCKMARAAFYQSEILAANLLDITQNKKPTKEYKPDSMEGALKLTLGKDNTAMYIDRENGKSLLMAHGGTHEDMDIKRGWGLFGIKYKDELTK